MKNFNLKGRTALITGASRGIGLTVAKKLAECEAQFLQKT